MKTTPKAILITALFMISINSHFMAQTYLLGPEEFNTDVIVHGSTAPTTVWFAPDYNTALDFYTSGGCTNGHVGYSGSWNNYWANFLRTPQINCAGYDSVILSFDLSNSYFSAHPNDKVYFNMWIEGAYHNASTNQTILFDEARNCTHFDVTFDLTSFSNKNTMFYLNASCAYNDAQTYVVKFDNIAVYVPFTTSIPHKTPTHVEVSVFPNPASSLLNIETNTHTDACVISIYDMHGHLLKKLKSTGAKTQVNISDLADGMYYIRIDFTKSSMIKKFVKTVTN